MSGRRVAKTLLAIPGAFVMTLVVAAATYAVRAERRLRNGGL